MPLKNKDPNLTSFTLISTKSELTCCFWYGKVQPSIYTVLQEKNPQLCFTCHAFVANIGSTLLGRLPIALDYVGLLMLAAYFCQVEYNCVLIKLIGKLLVSHEEELALHWLFSSGVGVQFAQSSSQWEARADT
jgi:hypothetical protein